MAFAGCMVAFFLVTIIDAIRTIRRNRGRLLQTMLIYKSGIAYTLCSCAVLALLPLWFIIPNTAHPAIAWTAFFAGLTILTIRLIRS